MRLLQDFQDCMENRASRRTREARPARSEVREELPDRVNEVIIKLNQKQVQTGTISPMGGL